METDNSELYINNAPPKKKNDTMRWVVIGAIVGFILLIAVAVGLSWVMVSNPAITETLRDVFIIWMAFVSILIGVALVVLIIQVARLTNLLQHEIKPILDNTNQTINTVRGTAAFVSENVSEPMVKISSTVAGVTRFVQLLTPGRKSKRKR